MMPRFFSVQLKRQSQRLERSLKMIRMRIKMKRKMRRKRIMRVVMTHHHLKTQMQRMRLLPMMRVLNKRTHPFQMKRKRLRRKNWGR